MGTARNGHNNKGGKELNVKHKLHQECVHIHLLMKPCAAYVICNSSYEVSSQSMLQVDSALVAAGCIQYHLYSTNREMGGCRSSVAEHERLSQAISWVQFSLTVGLLFSSISHNTGKMI